MQAHGFNAYSLSKKAGLNETAVRDIISGRVHSPRANTLGKLASALGVAPVDLITETEPAVAEPVLGAVQAGLWTTEEAWPPLDGHRQASAPLDTAYPPDAQFLLENRGNSMDKVFPDGAILRCVRWSALGRMPRDGDIYVVRRTSAKGEHEVTVKRLRYDEAGAPWLWPESTDPRFQQPLAVDGGEGESEVEILAKVLGFAVEWAKL